jgi:beta-phosphoglucomutase-like phosphatase (HAD superfamily)
VVSASRRESIEACLEKFDLQRHFSTLTSGSEVEHSNPFPDPYIAAMQALRATPGNAIALEDSLTGYRAARAASLKCIVCPDHFIPNPDYAFEQVALITNPLEQLCADTLHILH